MHRIKQVEQVTKSALEGPTWPFARIPSMGVTDAVEILVFLIWQLLHWLLFGCKNSQNIQKRPGDLFAKGQSGNAAGPNRRFHEPGPLGCRAVAPPNSVRLIHNLRNLACCPDFQSESLPNLRCALKHDMHSEYASPGRVCRSGQLFRRNVIDTGIEQQQAPRTQ